MSTICERFSRSARVIVDPQEQKRSAIFPDLLTEAAIGKGSLNLSAVFVCDPAGTGGVISEMT